MSEIDNFQHGFFGSSGTGAGKHANAPTDNLDAEYVNRLENAIVGLYTAFEADGLYGPFRFETVTGMVTEYFNGDGTTTGFTLSRAIHEQQVSGYDIYLADPYELSVEPVGYGGKLANFDDDNKLSNTFNFDTAPPSGTKNVKIRYYIYSKLPSKLDGGAYIHDWIEG